MTLTDEQLAMLDLEASWWAFEGAKTTAIRERLGMSPVRYYQALNWLIDQPAAMEQAPMVVRRLQRLRDRRRSARRAG